MKSAAEGIPGMIQYFTNYMHMVPQIRSRMNGTVTQKQVVHNRCCDITIAASATTSALLCCITLPLRSVVALCLTLLLRSAAALCTLRSTPCLTLHSAALLCCITLPLRSAASASLYLTSLCCCALPLHSLCCCALLQFRFVCCYLDATHRQHSSSAPSWSRL